MSAEPLALDLTAQKCLQTRLKGKKIYILSVSQAVIKVVRANNTILILNSLVMQTVPQKLVSELQDCPHLGTK